MVLPSLNKTRAMRGAEAEFLTRHLDAETSYLLKAFLLLVHPVLVVFEESCRCCDSIAEVRDSMLIGRMHAKDVSKGDWGKVC